MNRDEAAVPKEERPDTGLSRQFGTVGGSLQAWGEATDLAPQSVLQLIDSLGIAPMVDTGVDNPKDKSYDRPDDPGARRLVLREDNAEALLSSVEL